MDDVLTGANTLNELLNLKNELMYSLDNVGMKLRKWASNSDKLLGTIPMNDREPVDNVNETIKTLGVVWKPKKDTFLFCVKTFECHAVTKRMVLSSIAKLYDPLGFIGPVVVIAKLIMQKIWLSKIGWDDYLAKDLNDAWLKFQSQLGFVNDIELNRWVMVKDCNSVELHGFSDASQSAYGACVYVRCRGSDGKITCSLVCSKSRIAPLRVITIPKLELNAALLLARLVVRVKDSMDINYDRVFLWTDSSIVLSWIRLHPNSLKSYVGHRVTEIQRITRDMIWRHVDTTKNPADMLSRGVPPDELRDKVMWWHGPEYLFNDEETWPNKFKQVKELPEVKLQRNVVLNVIQFEPIIIIERFSTYTKLLRVTAYVLRYIRNLQSKEAKQTKGLTYNELNKALKLLVGQVQYAEYGKEIKLLQSGRTLDGKSKILNLNPFLDDDNLLRVGGRLRNSSYDFNRKHPYLLSKHHFTNLIIDYEHRRNFHSGIQSTLSFVRQRFWPINGKNCCKHIIHKCVTCYKLKPKPVIQLMGDLPRHRVEGIRPFNITGTNFCGPFEIKHRNQRKGSFEKVFVCIFVCFTTKAVHIEIVDDGTTIEFLECLKRFVSRRGLCKEIWSDNASNYKGASNELTRFIQVLRKSEEHISDVCAQFEMIWKFIPARSPHFGGIWESAVKIFKFHLKRVIGSTILTYKQLHSLSVQIEGIMNSRPLTPLSLDPNDKAPLTPGHFLTGGPINMIIEPDLTTVNCNLLSHWKKVTQMVQHFWLRFSTEYLHTLQQRGKWTKAEDNLCPGELVLMKNEKLPITTWVTGRVQEVIKGKDGKVRVAMVYTTNGIFKRAVTQLCKLPTN